MERHIFLPRYFCNRPRVRGYPWGWTLSLSFNWRMAKRSLIWLQPFQTCSGCRHQTKHLLVCSNDCLLMEANSMHFMVISLAPNKKYFQQRREINRMPFVSFKLISLDRPNMNLYLTSFYRPPWSSWYLACLICDYLWLWVNTYLIIFIIFDRRYIS